MRGKRYLDLAREIILGGSEMHWRGAAGRAYYALMLECREALARWGFRPQPRESVHSFVRARFSSPSEPSLNLIGKRLRELHSLRNSADYDLASVPAFSASTEATDAIRDAEYALLLLDHLESDPALLAAAIAAIKAAFP
jgi:hypothetical protein